ncbi:MAG: RNA 2',3'-cyclic phosphodiesterase [Sulfolobales archaeon]
MINENMNELIRSFIAVEIENHEVRRRIIEFKNMISSIAGSSIKPVEDENIHLTIRFLGEIDLATLDSVKKILDKLTSFKRFELHIRGVGGFPSLGRPRVIWIGIEKGFENLREIRRYIDSFVSKLRVQPDQHEFHPHITIGRVKTSLPPKVTQILADHTNEDFGITPVSKIYLKKSTLTPRGPVYSDLYYIELS